MKHSKRRHNLQTKPHVFKDERTGFWHCVSKGVRGISMDQRAAYREWNSNRNWKEFEAALKQQEEEKAAPIAEIEPGASEIIELAQPRKPTWPRNAWLNPKK